MGLKCPSVRTYVRPYVRPSKKSFSDSDEIWYVGRGRWVMHDGMPYQARMARSKVKVKVKVTRPWKLEILQFSKSISYAIFNVSWQMTTDSETLEQYLNFVWTRFLISVPVFASRDYEPQYCTGLIFQFANAFAIAITFARWWRCSVESTAVPYGANF